jgi:glycosyltransferase involved in cell wall biosynthesis
MMPKISVIVPVYNVEKYIHYCINSILEQSFNDFECILVDDCSPDNCPQICDEYEKRDNRIKVIHKEQNGGLPQARKTGIQAANGDFILFIDSDDWIELDMLEKMYNKAIAGNYDIVVSNGFNNTNDCQTDDIKPEIDDKILILKHLIMYWRYSPSVCDKLIRRDIYQRVILPKNNYGEDKVITIQTIYYAEKIGYVQDCLYHYRKNQESICSSKRQADKTIDEYHNFIVILKFLSDKELIPAVEHELRYRVNTLKLSFLKDKKLRKTFNTILEDFYPESTDNLFKNIYMDFFNKLILFLAIKKNPLTFFIIDTSLFFVFILKKIYGFILSESIRSGIRARRERKNQNRQIIAAENIE